MEADVIPRSEGAFDQIIVSLSGCVFLCAIYFYCYVTTLAPLYVRPLNPQTITIHITQ